MMRTFIIFSIIFNLCIPLSAEALNRTEVGQPDESDTQSISDSTFYELLKDYMCRRLGKDEVDVSLSKFKVTGNRPIPRGEAKFQVFQQDTRAPQGYIRLAALVSVNGVVSNKVGISAWVDVFEPVLCAARKMKKGEILGSKDIYTVRKNTSYLSTEVITDSSKALGFMAKHTIQADRPLERWMLERAPVLEKGDIVTILAESRDLTVTVPGMVLENGYQGELVMVQNTMSKKELYARVLNNTTVKVIF